MTGRRIVAGLTVAAGLWLLRPSVGQAIVYSPRDIFAECGLVGGNPAGGYELGAAVETVNRCFAERPGLSATATKAAIEVR